VSRISSSFFSKIYETLPVGKEKKGRKEKEGRKGKEI